MDSNTTGDLVLRPARWRAGTVLAICAIVLGPLALVYIAGVFLALLQKPPEWGVAVGAAFLGAVVLVVTAFFVLDVLNSRLVLSRSELFLTDAFGRRWRSMPRGSITAVWGATLPKRTASSDVPTFPRKVVVVTGSGTERPVVFDPDRFSPADVIAVWERLGRLPADLGKMTDRELYERFPDAKESLGEARLGCLVVILAYAAIVAVLLAFIGVAWLLSPAG